MTYWALGYSLSFGRDGNAFYGGLKDVFFNAGEEAIGTRYVHYVFQVRSQLSFRAFALLSVLFRHRRHNDRLWGDSGAYETARLHDFKVALALQALLVLRNCAMLIERFAIPQN